MESRKRQKLNEMVLQFRYREMKAWVLAGIEIERISSASRQFVAAQRFIDAIKARRE